MKNLILFAMIGLFSSSVFADDCLFGRCSQPVKRVAAKAADVTRVVVSAPVKVCRNVASNVQSRRSLRRSR